MGLIKIFIQKKKTVNKNPIFNIVRWITFQKFQKKKKMLMGLHSKYCRNAFGPSFGTVCFSGLIIGAVRVVRATVDSVKRDDAASGILNLILRCCADVVLSAIDFLNKFTIIFVAITGEGYCSSAKMTYELLKRNLLSAVFVETVSTRILVGIIFVLSAIYAILVSSNLLTLVIFYYLISHVQRQIYVCVGQSYAGHGAHDTLYEHHPFF